MNLMGHLCRELWQNENMTQRQIAARMGISLGKCNGLTRKAQEEGLIESTADTRRLTQKGQEYLAQYRVENAVILAAGIDVRFVPFTHEKPKSLMEVEGERLIERQIHHLQEKGITDITVVVGYLAEKFEYLVDEFGVKLLYNAEYSTKNNLASLHKARHLLGNTYLLTADHWYWANMFHEFEPESWYCCHWHEGATHEACAETDGKRRIRAIRAGGRDKLVMRGPVYFSRDFSQKLVPLLEAAYETPAGGEQRWETVLRGRLEEMPLYANILPAFMVHDFANFEELRDFDLSYAEQSGNKNLRNIARIFGVPEGSITDMIWLDVGMTNQSFIFSLEGERYIYRIPGEGSENFISRRQEAAVYKAVEKLGIADEVVHFDAATGIKIAKYYPNSHNVDDGDFDTVRHCMGVLRKLHLSGAKVKHSFDIEERMRKYEAMCRKVDCIRFADYDKARRLIETPLQVIRETAEPKVLCHIDAANVNFLVKEDGSLCLLDWEYGGMCHGVADVAMFAVFSNYSVEQLDMLLGWYFGRPPTREEQLLCYSYAAVAGILWSLWAEYRQYYGEDFGEYAMVNYRLGKNMSALVKRMLEEAA